MQEIAYCYYIQHQDNSALYCDINYPLKLRACPCIWVRYDLNNTRLLFSIVVKQTKEEEA